MLNMILIFRLLNIYNIQNNHGYIKSSYAINFDKESLIMQKNYLSQPNYKTETYISYNKLFYKHTTFQNDETFYKKVSFFKLKNVTFLQ